MLWSGVKSLMLHVFLNWQRGGVAVPEVKSSVGLLRTHVLTVKAGFIFCASEKRKEQKTSVFAVVYL